MKDYERTCYIAQPNPIRGERAIPDFEVMEVEQCGDDEYDVWIKSGDSTWWLEFNDWLLSYITEPTWIGHHAPACASLTVRGRDATLFKLMQTGVWTGGPEDL